MNEDNKQNVPTEEASMQPSTETESPKEDEIEEDEFEPTFVERFITWYKQNTARNTLVLILVLILVLFMTPQSRYGILSKFIKTDVDITVLDTKLNLPVSGAEVMIGGKKHTTSAEGTVRFTAVPVGYQTVEIKKAYYADFATKITIGTRGTQQSKLKIATTGRRTPVIVIDATTKQPVAGATITFRESYAITTAQGEVYMALPDDSPNVQATIQADGYQSQDVEIFPSSIASQSNTFELVAR